jgi:hypothetical protein
MAIVYWDDFEWAQTSTLGYRQVETNGTPSIVTVVTGVSGMTGRSLNLSSITATVYSGYNLSSNYTEGLFSVACFINGTIGQRSLLSLCAGAVENIVIRVNPNSSVTALRAASVLPGSSTSAAGVIPVGKRFRIEVAFVISDTVGEITVSVDSGSGATTVLNLTGVDTREASDTSGIVNRFRLYNNNTAINYFDDLWFDDDKTAFRTDQTFQRLAPSADVSGVSTPSTGSDRFAMIDESPASTTDFNTFAVTGEDVYHFEDLGSVPPSIAGVGVMYIANKPNAGVIQFRSRLLSGVDYVNGVTTGLNMSTLGYSDFYHVDPQGGTPWTKQRIDEAKLVLERIS